MATNKKTTSIGVEPNVASSLFYIPFVGWLAGVVLLLIEKNPSVKWHAAQGAILGISLLVLTQVFPYLPILRGFVSLVYLVWLLVGLFLCVKTYQGNTYKLPVVSDWADKLVKKM